MQTPTRAGARMSASVRSASKHPGKRARALGLVIGAAALASVLVGGSALAATADTVSGPAPFPPSGVMDLGGTSLCPFEPQIVEADTYNPEVGTAANGSAIAEDVGAVGTADAGCGDSVTFYLETKVCGVFGCNWKVVDQATYHQLPTHGTLVSRLLTAPLRSGTNRYRVRTEITTDVMESESDPEPGFIGVVPEVEEVSPIGAQLTHP